MLTLALEFISCGVFDGLRGRYHQTRLVSVLFVTMTIVQLDSKLIWTM